MRMSHSNERLTFIGSGNMATAIIGGLVEKKFPPAQIQVCGPSAGELERLNTRYGVITSHEASDFMNDTDILLLCVKPQVMQSVCEALGPHTREATVVSIAAGVTTDQLRTWLGRDVPIVRCMPNTPAMVHEGATGLYAAANVEPRTLELIESLFAAIGRVRRVSAEAELHAVTALSGSGPAYGFYLLEAMIAAGQRMGLSADTSKELACQTLLGAASLAQASEDAPATLKQRVMSPGGTTEQAVFHLRDNGFSEQVQSAILKAWQRSYTLAGEEPPRLD